jgi:hypothetical protein
MDGSVTYDVVAVQTHYEEYTRADTIEFFPASRAEAEELIAALVKGGAARVEDEEQRS